MLKLHRSLIDSLNKLFTNVYKLVGFVVLLVILGGLGSYFAINAFYLGSRSWLAPIILSPSHDRVVELNSQLAQHLTLRDKLQAEREGYELELRHTDRLLENQARFRDNFAAALKTETAAKQEELSRVGGLVRGYRDVRSDVEESSKRFRTFNESRLDGEFEAGLIDEQRFVDGVHSLSQVESSSLKLREGQIAALSQRDELSRQVGALEALVDAPEGAEVQEPAALTYDVLMRKAQYDESVLESQRLGDLKENLRHQLQSLDRSIARYDRILDEIKGSPYLRAMDERVHIAFVPYDNLEEVRAGEPVYGCHFGLVWCEPVGKVGAVVDGEVTATHPIFREEIRGQMVELLLDDEIWAEDKALFAGHAPLLF